MNEEPTAPVALGVRSNLSSLSLMIADSTRAEIVPDLVSTEWCARVAAAL